MNKIHNVIWSTAQNAWVVVAEGTKRSSKSGAKAISVMIALIMLSPTGASATTLPQGGQISVGQGTIVNNGGSQLVIKQTSDKLGVNWQSFNVGADGQVVFEQPNAKSIAMNRVVGSDASSILGKIDANGQVILINPNGVIVGKDAQVNVGGLVASTLNLTDDNFKKGDYSFTADGGKNGEVLNQGTIQAAEGGYVALLGKSIKNQGIIKAQLGNAALAAGSAVTLDFSGDGLLNIQVKQSAVNALVDNKGLIKADGGSVLMTARASNALLNTVVNNEGVIEAQTLGSRGGKIFLDGGQDDGAVHVAGTLDASAPVSGSGGFIETSGKTVKIDDGTVITTSAPKGKSGTWLVDPTDFTISAGSGGQTASGIGASTLVTALGSGNVILQTAAGGTDKGDINVNADVAWSSDNTLTLTAANSINVNANINIFGSSNGGLVMNFATPNYYIAKGSAITLSSSGTPTYTENGHAFFIIKSLSDLLQLDNAAKSGGYFALGTSLDASATSGWNGGLGYAPALMGSTFQGTINGLGNSITNLSINRPTQGGVGLIGKSTNANISNLAVAGTVSGNTSVGLIIGDAVGGSLYNVYGAGSVINASAYTGGLIGQLSGGTLTNNNYQGTVYGTSHVGGIVGYGLGGSNISGVYSTGNVSGTDYVGGLVGLFSASTLSNSYSQSTVSGAANIGGLIGRSTNNGIISDVYSTGNVTGTGSYTGGLLGYLNGGTLTNSYSTGMVSGAQSVGGLVGVSITDAIISDVYSTGNVTGTDNFIGGLVGDLNSTTLTNGYSLGKVFGVSYVGGVVGYAHYNAIISNVSSIGDVTGSGTIIGGLVGQTDGSTLTASHSQSTVSGTQYVGGIIGRSLNASNISYVYATGNVTNTGAYTGGLLGYLNGGILSHSYSMGTVSGTQSVGGAVGTSISSASISDVYSTGDVTGSGNYIGGLVGDFNATTLSNSYSLSTVSGAADVGGVVGYSHNNAGISNVSSTGNVTGTGSYTGGLVGYLTVGTLTNSYFHGTVSGAVSVGGIVGYATTNPYISNVHSTGSVTGTGTGTGGVVGSINGGTLIDSYSESTVSGTANVGGVVGTSNTSANISNVYSTGNVTGTANNTGGLVGYLTGSSKLSNGYSMGAVSGMGDVGGGVGGSFNSSIISNVYSTGNISGTGSVGGVVGFANTNSSISSVYSTGNVTGTDTNTGGLVGYLSGGTLTNGYALGRVYGVGYVGGVLGYGLGSAIISTVYSTGDVTSTGDNAGGIVGALYSGAALGASFSTSKVSGTNAVGGLVGGMDTSSIANSYATGAVSGTSAVGGLVGLVNNGQISNVYSTGLVSATDTAGGLIGSGTGTNAIAEAYWDTTLSGQGSDDFGVGYASLTDPTIFSTWDIAHTGGSSNTWRMYDGLTGPLLRVFMGTATASAGSASTTTYNGQNQLAGDYTSPALTTSPAAGFFQPHANQNAWSLTQNGAAIRNAGSYVIDGWYSTQFGYDIIDVTKSTVVVNKAALVVTANGVDRVYNGTTDGSVTFSDNRFAGDNLTLSAVAKFSDKNVGSGKAISVTGISASGADAQNYDWNITTSTTADITKASLTITATGVNKTYDGTTTATDATLSDNRFGSDDLWLSSTSTAFADKNAGIGKFLNVTGIDVVGTDANNYIWNTAAVTTADIDRASLVVKANNDTKVEGYSDGVLNWSLQSGSLIAGDSITGSLARDAGESAGQYTINKGTLDAGMNYDLAFIAGTYDITAAATPPVVTPPVVTPPVTDPITPPVVKPPVITEPALPVVNVKLEKTKEVIASISSSTKIINSPLVNVAKKPITAYRMVNLGMRLPDDALPEETVSN
jgi:filamentous hemagglutinin family protein